MTKSEIIKGLKDAWTRALMDEKDIREDIAESYSAWVQGIVKAAAPELQGEPAAQEGSGQGQDQGQGQGQEQGAGAAPGGVQMPGQGAQAMQGGMA